MAHDSRSELGRRGFLGAAGTLAAVSLLGGANTEAAHQAAGLAVPRRLRPRDAGSWDDWRFPASASAFRT